MFNELALSTVMALLAVSIHGFGLLSLGRGLEMYEIRANRSYVEGPLWRHALLTIVVVLGLFVLHGAEIWMYAALYKTIGAVPDMREAVYFSSISYGSIGYDDSLMAPQWRLLGAIEGVAGAILLGWSIAFFVSVMTPFTARRKHGLIHRDDP
ncbi:MAG: ion channel [Brevundimonas sp.]|uniref:ion channel n=1 Tax=Brevundimonas sp. TaxID=1871086 RepID=UPI002623F560|nr:ion channel [Brevundimonas sp.]MDI6625365.1 ion channel [Brevundimonas sp.]MDQ7812650.1 ion channel [Brevundimonas sp.]